MLPRRNIGPYAEWIRAAMPNQLSDSKTAPLAGADATAVLEHVAIPVMMLDARATIVHGNGEARRMVETGELKELWTQPELRQALARALRYRISTEWTRAVGLGPARPYRLHLAPLPGLPPRAVLSLTPITSDPADEPDDGARRFTSLGKLASRVAHELNNPLDGILRYINLALRVAGDSPDSRLISYLSESRSGLMRMIRIIGDLLEFSRNSDDGFEEMPVSTLIEQAIQDCAARAEAHRVVIAADYQSADLPRVRSSRLHQICCNLIRNAIDAMPEGGRLSVVSGRVDGRLIVRVTDTGGGLPDPPDKVFEPFYTTKPPGKGTGLGLAICREFAQDMGGDITAGPAPGGGAVFTVTIPLAGLTGPQRLSASRPNNVFE
jgi:signal transduction histidine kinase